MQILRSFIVAAVAAFQLSPPPHRSGLVLVTAVFDGDTINVATIGHVRLLGIDAPEISHGLDTAAPFAREAKDRLAGLVLHHWVRLEYEGAREDIYGRRLAYVLAADESSINAVLLREGLARLSARTPLTRLDELRRAEAEAQGLRRGIWGTAPAVAPQEVTVRSRSSAASRTAAKLRPRTSRVTKTSRKPRVAKARRPASVRKRRLRGLGSGLSWPHFQAQAARPAEAIKSHRHVADPGGGGQDHRADRLRERRLRYDRLRHQEGKAK